MCAGARTGSVVLVLLPLLLSSARKIHLVICSPRPVASGGVSFARLVAAPLHPPHLQLQVVDSAICPPCFFVIVVSPCCTH